MNAYSQAASRLPSRGVSQPIKLPGGGVMTAFRLNGRYVDFMTRAELQGLESLAKEAQVEAVALSQGPLSLAELRRRGHPYGRGRRGRRRGLGRLQGRRAGVSNMDVLNKQSGTTAASWQAQVDVDKSGATVRLVNTSDVAAFTALGTKKMESHGPYRIALLRKYERFIKYWRLISQRAQRREQQMQSIRVPKVRPLAVRIPSPLSMSPLRGSKRG